MTLNDFIKKYDSSNNKDKCLLGSIKTKYASFQDKTLRCKKIIDSSSHINVDGEKIFMSNRPARHLLTCLSLIELYTNIEVDYDNSLSFYDEINKRGIIDMLISIIGEKEYNEFLDLLAMCAADLQDNERGVISYIDRNKKSLMSALDLIINSIPDVENAELEVGA